MTVEERTPLKWPEGFPRTQYPERSRFGDRTVTHAIKHVVKHLDAGGDNAKMAALNKAYTEGMAA